MIPTRRPPVSARGFMILALGMTAMATPAAAQEQTYPAHPIKLVVPFGPGGPTDVIARVVSQVLQASFGRSVVIENKPGAGGALGTRAVAMAEPDGYTLLLGTVATLGALPAVQKNPGFDPVNSFVAVAQMTESTPVLTTPYDLPARDVSELVAYSKANPNKLNYASAGVGNQTQLNAELFKFRTGASIAHIPYKSGAEMVTALLSNQAQAAFLDISLALPYLKDKKLRTLAVTGVARHPSLPDTPTMIESGVADFVAVFWTGILAPAGTPPAIVAKLNGAVNDGLNTPDVKEMLSRIAAKPMPGPSDTFGAYVASEAKKWRDTVKFAGIEAE